MTGWTLDRDWLRSDTRQHRLRLPGGTVVWLSDAEADAIEAVLPFLNGVRPMPDTGPQRFTVRAVGSHGVDIIDADGSAECFTFDSREQRDAFVAQVNGTRTDDLPAGVHRIDGRLWLLPNMPKPAGWEYRSGTGRWFGFDDGERLSEVFAFEVRPVQQPDTERVPWWEAVGRKDDAHQTISTVGFGSASACPFFITSGGLKRNVTAADGTVEVLKDGGRS